MSTEGADSRSLWKTPIENWVLCASLLDAELHQNSLELTQLWSAAAVIDHIHKHLLSFGVLAYFNVSSVGGTNSQRKDKGERNLHLI